MNPLQLVSSISDPLLSILYPQVCGSCSGDVDSFRLGPTCSICWNETRLFTGNETICGKCGAFQGESPAENPVTCGRCDAHEYDSARAAGVYAGGLKDAVIRLKSEPWASPKLKQVVADAFTLFGLIDSELIVPVPLSKKRSIERGYNQAEVIGKIISNAAGIQVDAALNRVLDTPMHRVGMDQKARELTVKKAFAVSHPRLVNGRDVVLVDDVFTSGATASACASVLKENGAARVRVFTLARAVLGR